MAKSYDVVIGGGAAMGSSTAYFLTKDPALRGRVLVVEKDPSYANCATSRSAGSIRQQFSTPENIQISLFGIDFLRHVGEHLSVDGDAPALSLREAGYLFLASTAGASILKQNHEVQKRLGADNVLLDAAGLKARFPWMNTDDIALGSLGLTMEGWFDPNALLHGFRKKARQQGADYIADKVVAVEKENGRVVAVRLKSGERVACGHFVNATGIQGAKIAASVGAALPVRPKKRFVFVLDCPEKLPGCPLVIDMTGAYVRPEGQFFVCGIQPPEDQDPDCEDLEVDHGFFEEHLWAILAARIPALEQIKVVNAWAGHYDYNTFDQNAVIGPHPEVSNFYFCNGFSGHGIQQSPAVGRALAEIITKGRFVSLDLSRFTFARIAKGEPIVELNVV